MELEWTHLREQKLLKTVIFNELNQELCYTTADGGGVINKYFNNNLIGTFKRTPNDSEWDQEKQFLSEHYSDYVGEYKPMWHLLNMSDEEYHIWVVDNNWQGAMPIYGISEGVYLDRLQRHAYLQEGREMENYYLNELTKTWIEVDDNNNYYKREWCEEQNTFYNVQPCCIFPNNPGRTPITKQEAESIKNPS